MTKESLAALLNGRECWKEITEEEELQAKENGLVIIFGASDDLTQIRGVVCDELYIYDATESFRLHKNGVLIRPDEDDYDTDGFDDKFSEYLEQKNVSKEITSIWSESDFSWTFKTEIPHSTFEILDDECKYCRGIVFSVEDL